ncbi:O-antigen ligase family protein [Marinifilum flexuosum]|uniref:O-antigen ligase family protein n=1 Tax=Marinifilum flexuosum TaxID=1117708 RepID=UPI00249180E4|nr:O-antigen ligase family protein [Marinifilum flexuosum]
MFDDVLPLMVRPSTVIALIFPAYTLIYKRKTLKVDVFLIFSIIFLYSVLSIFWTPNFEEVVKFTLLVQPINLLLLLSVIIAGKYANDPLKSITKGWILFFIFSCVFGLYEIIFDQHLPTSLQQSGEFVKDGDFVLIRRFASFTYGNYNTFVTVISMGLPMIFASSLFTKCGKTKALNFFLLPLVSYILIMNGSRGGILCFILNLFFFLYYKKIFSIKFFIVLLILGGVISVLLVNVNLDFLLYRIASGQIFQGSTRVEIISVCVEVIKDYYFLGTGFGSMNYILKQYMAPIPAAHNMIFEFVLEYGLLTFIIIITHFSLKISNIKTTCKFSRYVLSITLLTFPVYTVINSVYLVYSFVWVWLGTAIVLFNVKKENYE